MTAGSIELFPIRVTPIGVPPRPLIPVNPSPISRQRVCRNLFGVAESGSVESELRNEERNKISEWKRRFNVDLSEMKIAAAATAATETATATETKKQKSSGEKWTEQAANLIEQEQRAFDEALADDEKREEKCNSSSEKLREAAETTPQPHRSSCSNGTTPNNLSTSGTKHRNHSDGQGCTTNLRSLPYARQKLISECFTTRRKPISQTSCLERPKNWSDLWEETPATGALLLVNASTIKETTAPRNLQHQHQQQSQQQRKT